METCRYFISCSANICPRDPDVHLRSWLTDEDICRVRKFQHLPVIQSQRKLKKMHSKDLQTKYFKYDGLLKLAPKKRVLSAEHKASLLAAAKKHQFRKKADPSEHDSDSAT